MRHLVTAALLVGGLIHLLPLTGLMGAARLQSIYGVAVNEANLELLLRHRAVLFGLLGAFMLGALRFSDWRLPALVAGLVSTLSFIVLAFGIDTLSAELRRVMVIDVAVAVLLGVGLVVEWLLRENA